MRQWSNETRKIVVNMRNAGSSAAAVFKATGVAERTQREMLADIRNGITEKSKKDCTLFNNNNCKIIPEFIDRMKEIIKEKPDLYDHEIAKRLDQELNISLTPARIQQLRKKYKITRKLKQKRYSDRYSKNNIEYLENFKKVHRPKFGKLKYFQIASTDEAGFESTIKRRYAKSQVKITKISSAELKKRREISGGSYQDKSSVIYDTTEKHHSFRLNLVATICLNPATPVVFYKLDCEYTNGDVFAQYVLDRDLPPHITHDFIDRASVHRSVKANNKHGQMPVPEAYSIQHLKEDFIPTGYPELNPIEQLFAWLRKKLEEEAPKYVENGSWTESKMIEIIEQLLCKVDYELVKGFYRNSFQQAFPDHKIPKYMQEFVRKIPKIDSTAKKRRRSDSSRPNKKHKLC